MISNLLINKFIKREKINYEINKQTEQFLSIFDIEKENNQHHLSSFFLKKMLIKKKLDEK